MNPQPQQKFNFDSDDPDDEYWNAGFEPIGRGGIFSNTTTSAIGAGSGGGFEDLFESLPPAQNVSTTQNPASSSHLCTPTQSNKEHFESSPLTESNIRQSNPLPQRSLPLPLPRPHSPRSPSLHSSAQLCELQSVATSDDVSSMHSGGDDPAANISTSNTQRHQLHGGRNANNNGSMSVVSDCSVNSLATTTANNDDASGTAAKATSAVAALQLDYTRLKHEHRKLQRHFETALNERFKPPTIEETIKRLKRCQPAPLDGWYRTCKEKLELLAAAERSLDHDVIVTVVLHLKRTLSSSLFWQALTANPTAAEHYLSHLREVDDHEELIATLFSLNRINDAAMVKFSTACQQGPTAQEKLHALKKCFITPSGGGEKNAYMRAEQLAARDYVNLLERQLAIEAADEEAISAGRINEWMRRVPKKASLVGQSLYTTVYYCCLYHYDLPANAYSSPHCLKAAFSMGEREFAYIAASALARLQRFGELERLLTPNRRLPIPLPGASKLASPIPWWEFFSLLRRHGCPPREHLQRWLRAVADPEERLRICERLLAEERGAREVEVESVVALGDRQKLIALMNRMEPGSVEFARGEVALVSGANKWKN